VQGLARLFVRKVVRRYRRAIVLAWCAASVITPLSAVAATRGVTQSNRFGLVIANSRYANPKDSLPGARRDGTTIVDALKSVGFEVTLVQDANREQIEKAVKAFQAALKKGGPTAVGLLYYAGHGGTDRGRKDNYLLPVDVENVAAANLAERGVGVRWITDSLRNLDERPAIAVVIDACRTTASENFNRGGGSAGPGAGFDMIEPDQLPDKGYLIAFSTSKGQPASDNGQYAQALADKLRTEGLSLDQVFEHVRQTVGSKTQQLPIYMSTLVAKVCLVSCDAVAAGAYGQNATLFEATRKDTEAAMKALESLQPETQCRRGWNTLIELRDSARKQSEMGHPDAAGQTYIEITRRVTQIRAYLLALSSIERSRQRVAGVLEATSVKNQERSKNYYDRYRDQFAADAAPLLKPETRRKEFEEIARFDSEAETLAKAGRYGDATEKLIDGINFVQRIQDERQRSGRREIRKPSGLRNEERSKRYYDEYRDKFSAAAAPFLKPETQRKDLDEVMRFDSEADALAKAGRYDDATDKIIDALNLLHRIQGEGERTRGEIRKPPRSRPVESPSQSTDANVSAIRRQMALLCD